MDMDLQIMEQSTKFKKPRKWVGDLWVPKRWLKIHLSWRQDKNPQLALDPRGFLISAALRIDKFYQLPLCLDLMCHGFQLKSLKSGQLVLCVSGIEM